MNRSLKDFMLFRKLNFHICKLDSSFKIETFFISSIFNSDLSDFSLCTSQAKISASEISLSNENSQIFFSLIAINLLRIHTILDNIQICTLFSESHFDLLHKMVCISSTDRVTLFKRNYHLVRQKNPCCTANTKQQAKPLKCDQIISFLS